MSVGAFYDDWDQIWGKPGQTSSWQAIGDKQLAPPGPVGNNIPPRSYQESGMPYPPDSKIFTGREPNYTSSVNQPGTGMNRLAEVGMNFGGSNYGMGRMDRYGMGPMMGGMGMGGGMAGGRPGMPGMMGGATPGFGQALSQYARGMQYGPDPTWGGSGGGPDRGTQKGDGLSTLEKIWLGSEIAGTAADIYGGWQEGRRADREYEDEERRRKEGGATFGKYLRDYSEKYG